MKTGYLLRSAIVLAAIAAFSMNATAEGKAFCEVKKSGDKAKKATGHCEYSDMGDRVMINLANGENYTLTRKKDKKNAFKDQKGNGVHRDIKKNGTHFYKWEHKNITVYPEGN